jgi:hypothetical protein
MDPKLQDPYRNQKGTLSQNVMVACDFDNRSIHVSAGWEGSTSDAQVLQDALEHNFYALINWCRALSPSNVLPSSCRGSSSLRERSLTAGKTPLPHERMRLQLHALERCTQNVTGWGIGWCYV